MDTKIDMRDPHFAESQKKKKKWGKAQCKVCKRWFKLPNGLGNHMSRMKHGETKKMRARRMAKETPSLPPQFEQVLKRSIVLMDIVEQEVASPYNGLVEVIRKDLKSLIG